MELGGWVLDVDRVFFSKLLTPTTRRAHGLDRPAGDVEAGDDHQQGGIAEQQPQNESHATHYHLSEVDECRALIAVGIGILPLERLGDRSDVRGSCAE